MKYPIYKELNLGLTNQTYFAQPNFFVRYGNLTNTFFLDRENEMKVISLIKKWDYTLPIIDYGYENNSFYLVTNYVENLKTFGKITLTLEEIQQVANIIKALHYLSVENVQIKTFAPQEFLLNFKKAIKNELPRIEKEEDKIDYNLLANYDKKVLCHNDLTPGNFIIVNNKVKLIDFEYAMMNDYLFDVASFISETLTTKWEVSTWLKQFNLTDQEQQRLSAWIHYQNVVWIYWASYMKEKTNKLIFTTIVNKKFQQLKNPWTFSHLTK